MQWLGQLNQYMAGRMTNKSVNGLEAWLLYSMGRYTVKKFKKQFVD